MRLSVKGKIFLRLTVAILLFAVAVFLLTSLLMPKYMTSVPEGALIAEYYREKTPHQVLFVGDCEVYENFSPVTLWEEYGITSYIRGSAQQLIWQSYYLLEEMLAVETPRAVVFNVLSVKYGEPQKEAYNRMALDGMKWSGSKWRAIRASMTEEENMITYFFPLLRFHSRWDELSGEDFRYWFSRDTLGHSGYLMQTDVRPLESLPPNLPPDDFHLPDTSMAYLEKMVELCRERGVELILIKAPAVYPLWYDEWDAQIESFAAEKGISYYNFLKLTEEIGLDFSRDTYDGGLHLNVWGAEKLASYFGEILVRDHGLTSQKDDVEICAVWEQKTAAYQAEYRRKTGGTNEAK